MTHQRHSTRTGTYACDNHTEFAEAQEDVEGVERDGGYNPRGGKESVVTDGDKECRKGEEAGRVMSKHLLRGVQRRLDVLHDEK
jgi:hypothetical protein